MASHPPKPRSAWNWILVLPPIGLLFPAFYSRPEPALFGFPFFYWYQLACVPVTSLLLYAIYRRIR